MTPVKVAGEAKPVLGFVASCRDCMYRKTTRSEEQRDKLAYNHTRHMEIIMKLKSNKEMAEKMLRAVISRLGEQETIDAFVANNEGYWCDPVTDAMIEALPPFDSDASVLLEEYRKSGESVTEALIKVMVTENPTFT